MFELLIVLMLLALIFFSYGWGRDSEKEHRARTDAIIYFLSTHSSFVRSYHVGMYLERRGMRVSKTRLNHELNILESMKIIECKETTPTVFAMDENRDEKVRWCKLSGA